MITVIANIKIAIKTHAKTYDEAVEMAENYELPAEYVEDSFEIDNVLDTCEICEQPQDDDGRCACANKDAN